MKIPTPTHKYRSEGAHINKTSPACTGYVTHPFIKRTYSSSHAGRCDPSFRPWTSLTLYWLLRTSVREKDSLSFHRPCTGYLGHPFKNKPFETEKDHLPCLQTQQGWCTIRRRHRILMLERRYSHVMEKLFVMAGVLISLRRLKNSCLDTLSSRFTRWTKPLTSSLPLGNPRRPWQKQVELVAENAHLTPTTHHSQATGETANVHQDRSYPPRPAGPAGFEPGSRPS